VFTVAVFYAMLFLFANLIGWQKLAKRYRTRGRSLHDPYRIDTALLGRAGFNTPPMLVGIDADGLSLHPRQPFSAAFGNVHIPWTAVVAAERQKYLLFDTLRLELQSGDTAFIGFVPSEVTAAIEAHLRRESVLAE
jgi:hypothetical protein